MLKIGSVGTSSVSKTMQEAIHQTEGLECTVICSRDEERVHAFAQAAGVQECCTDYDTMLSRDSLDIIYIASPNRLHFEQVMKAIEHGRHVFAEKPLTVTESESRQIIEAARAKHVFIFEAVTVLYMPNYLKCRSLLPKLGRIQHADIRYGQYSSKYDAYLNGENPSSFSVAMQGGALNDMGVYCINPAVDMFGIPLHVQYEPKYGTSGIDISGTLTLTYPTFTCTIQAAKDRDPGSGCKIEGENGWFAEHGPMNDFTTCVAELNGLPVIINEQHDENRMVHELARFRDAILKNDTAFFEHAAQQSIAVSAILEQAHSKSGNTRLLAAMAEYDKGDPMRIHHFMKVYEFARLIGIQEKLDSRTQHILETASIVHDIGIHISERKYGSSSGTYQEQEGPDEARTLLSGLGYEPAVIDRVCYLVGHHHTYTAIEGADYQILVEADFLVNLYEDYPDETKRKEAVAAAYKNIFRTQAGRKLCEQLYTGEQHE